MKFFFDAPEIISTEPYTGGWLLEIEVEDANEIAGIYSAAEYRSKVEG